MDNGKKNEIFSQLSELNINTKKEIDIPIPVNDILM